MFKQLIWNALSHSELILSISQMYLVEHHAVKLLQISHPSQIEHFERFDSTRLRIKWNYFICSNTWQTCFYIQTCACLVAVMQNWKINWNVPSEFTDKMKSHQAFKCSSFGNQNANAWKDFGVKVPLQFIYIIWQTVPPLGVHLLLVLV